MSQTIKSIEDENRLLQEKLSKLTAQEKILQKEKKPKLKPFSYKDLHKSTTSLNDVQSQLDFSLIMDKKKRKVEELKLQKEQLELKNCTFKPELNTKSQIFIKSQNYIPVHQRKLPEKKETAPRKLKEEEEFDRIQADIQKNKIKRKLDPEFFAKQLEWDKQKNTKADKERLNKALNEYSVQLLIKLSKKKDNEADEKSGEFLKRVENYMEKSKIKKKELDEKYNGHSFKPNINKNNQVQSVVFKDTTGLSEIGVDRDNK